MKIFKEILQYFKNDRQFDDREKRQLIDYSLHQALSYLRHYGENPRISLQPLNIPRTLVSALSDVKTSSNKESLRLAIVDTKSSGS